MRAQSSPETLGVAADVFLDLTFLLGIRSSSNALPSVVEMSGLASGRVMSV